MKFGIREITDVVFKTTSALQKLGSKTFTSQYDPVLFFDSAKTATMEGAVSTVYAQGGRGNSRLLAWDGDKTITFTFEDALMSAASFAALAGAGLSTSILQMHFTEKAIGVASGTNISLTISDVKGIPTTSNLKVLSLDAQGDIVGIVTAASATVVGTSVVVAVSSASIAVGGLGLVDFYAGQTGSRTTIDAENFAGYYYIEANTLFRGTDGRDYPAQFTIPKAKVQSNFTFTMAPTGDPSTFTFVLDAFPAPTRFDSTKNVLFVLEVSDTNSDII